MLEGDGKKRAGQLAGWGENSRAACPGLDQDGNLHGDKAHREDRTPNRCQMSPNLMRIASMGGSLNPTGRSKPAEDL